MTASNEQMKANLARGEAVRMARYRWFELLRGVPPTPARVYAATLIRYPPRELRTCRVTKLLIQLPQVRGERSRQLMRHLNVGEDRRLGELTPRLRELFAASVERRPGAWRL